MASGLVTWETEGVGLAISFYSTVVDVAMKKCDELSCEFG